ncbi:MAG: sulfate transporter CysZ [Gammaproteobacteria bacterium]|nr:sulfate transporter CysZ [Gammaproteobacteria bacterium]
MNSPMTGISYLLDGFSLITKSGIKRFVIIPLIVNIILFLGLFFFLRHYMHVFDAWFAGILPSWLQWLGSLLWLLFFVAFVLVFIYTFVTFANLISAPFNSLLAEKVEAHLTGQASVNQSMMATLKDVPRSLGRQIAVLGYYLPRALLLLLLFLLPFAQPFAALFWFLFNAWFMAMTFIDYPSDNHRISFQTTRLFLNKQRFTTFGFGISVLIASMVPFLNFFVIPAAVAGATKFWLKEAKLGNTFPPIKSN